MKKLVLKFLLVLTIVLSIVGAGITSFAANETVVILDETNTNTESDFTEWDSEEDNSTTTNKTTTTTTTTTTKSTKIDINTLDVDINTSTHTFTGKRRQCTITIYDGKKKLVKGKEYKPTYKNDVLPGKVSLTIQGVGKYTGTIKASYYIAPAKGKVTSVTMNSSYTAAKIKWERDKRADGYVVYKSTKKSGAPHKWIKIIYNNKNTSFTHKNLDPGESYYYTVRAFKVIDGKRVVSKWFSNAKTSEGLLSDVHFTASSSGSNRNHNLKLASNKINGTVLKPGQVFNWFKVVGPASKSRGYRLASVFSNGRTIKGYGGGVCQVSTTTYQASLKAGLKILERHLHSKPVTYIKWGQDATVSYGVQNLRIQNNKNYSVKFVSFAKGKTTYCKVYRVN